MNKKLTVKVGTSYFIPVLELFVSEIKKPDVPIQLNFRSEDDTSLVEIGCYGQILANIQSTLVGETIWIEGSASGGFNYECPICGSSIKGKFKVPIKLLLKMVEKGTFSWLDEEAQGHDDYVASIGPGEESFSIIPIIREQIILNCNVSSPESNAHVEDCSECKGDKAYYSHKKDKQTIDPRWEKLKSLKKKMK